MTGKDLKNKRKKIGVSQEKLAQMLEITVSTVSRWERLNENELPTSKLVELALTALEVGRPKGTTKKAA